LEFVSVLSCATKLNNNNRAEMEKSLSRTLFFIGKNQTKVVWCMN